MIKKFYLLLVALVTAFGLSAQHTPGSWTIFPMSGEQYDYVLDTPARVFYLTGGSLYSYDKEYNETVYYTPGDKISDTGIASIKYNKDGKYLLVAYTNSNIDLIYDDGRIINMPEIKNANISSAKTINHIFFGNGQIYLATAFGIVIYDDSKHQVIESGMYKSAVKFIFATQSHLLLVDSNFRLRISPLNEKHNTLDKFSDVRSWGTGFIQGCGNDEFIYVAGTNATSKFFKVALKSDASDVIMTEICDAKNITYLGSSKNGYTATGSDGLTYFNENGGFDHLVSIPSALASQTISSWNGASSVWAADGDGIGQYDITDGNVTTLSEKYRAQSSSIIAPGSKSPNSGYITPSPDGLSVYITPVSQSEYHPAGDGGWSLHLPFICERYDWATRTFNPVYPYGVENRTKDARAEATNLNSKYFFGGNGPTAIDPVDPEIIYHANEFEGLNIIKNREIIAYYDQTNSPLYFGWGLGRIYEANIDPMGGLWIGQWTQTPPSSDKTHIKSCYFVLTADKLEKLRKAPTSIELSDWQTAKIDDDGKPDMKTCFSHFSNKMIYIRGGWGGPLTGYDTKGTPSTADDVSVNYSGFLDQDGTITNPTFKPCIVEDKKGHFWIGTTSGIFVIEDLNQIADGSSNYLNARRPKVARNDGTNYADYLLASETILWIAVDPSNRKWIATQASGLYLVNEDGSEILEQFTSDNSPLITNAVYTVACDPNSNDILIGSADGMFLYSSTAAPAAEDYSNVYAFPNPVRPDYTGWITINGLMDNSLVKIADAQGNVIWTGRSEGGMVVWDGCNPDGKRVRSGVYLVLASHYDGSSSEGAVAKIVVIN